MSVAQANTFLHAVLLQRGHICEWVDSRASPAARYAQRAAQRHARWQSNDKLSHTAPTTT